MNNSFHPAAEAEFLESVGFYESKVPGLGGAFIIGCSLRSKKKVQGQWQLYCLVHNIEKLANYGRMAA